MKIIFVFFISLVLTVSMCFLISCSTAPVDESQVSHENSVGPSEPSSDINENVSVPDKNVSQTPDDISDISENEVSYDEVSGDETFDDISESSGDVSEKLISEDTALEKAVVKANVDSDEISNIKIELEYDNGEWQYEISFEDAHYEYKVTINAETGWSLGYERGWNEKYRKPAFVGTTGNIYAFKMRIKPSGMGIFIFQEVYKPMEPWFGHVDGSYGEPSFNDWITKYTDEWFEENRLFFGELIADGQIEIEGIYEKFNYIEAYDVEESILLLVYNQLTEEERVYEEDGSFYGYYFLLELPKEDYPEEHFTSGTGRGTEELPE